MLLLGIPAAALLSASIRITIRIFLKKKPEPSDEEGQEGEQEEGGTKTTPPIMLRVFVALLFLSISSFMFSIVIANFIQLSTISSFKQHIRVIAPYISDHEEEKLISEWSLMSSKQDYQLIYSKLDTIASDNNLELPENKIYSMLSLWQ